MEENTGHNSAIIIQNGDLYSEEYCLEYSGNLCTHSLTYYPEQTLDTYVKYNQQGNANTVSFGLTLFILVWVVKGILKRILPTSKK